MLAAVCVEHREGKRYETHQEIVQLMLVANVGPAFRAYRIDRELIEFSGPFQYARRDRTPQRYCTRPPLFESRFIEKRVGVGVEQLVRKLRRHRCIDCKATNTAVLDPAQNAEQPLQVHRLLQHILHHFPHQRMIGNLNITLDVFETRGRLGKDARHQIVGTRALNLRRDALSLGKAKQLQTSSHRPAPARLEYRRSKRGLLQQLLRRNLGQELKDIRQGEAVLLSERNVDAIVRSRSLKFKIESATKSLAQRQTPPLVDAPAERRMQP